MSHFDERFVALRVKRTTPADLSRKPNKWICSFRQVGGADRVLDIACGMGFDSMAWARAGKRPVGIDFNFDLVRTAAALAREQGVRVDFVVADATRLPFRAETFDVTYSENLFEHVPRWWEIGEEASRVLRPNGVFFVRTTNRICPKNNEINYMPFYPWLPDALKRPILEWVKRNRPAWINFTTFPAVNWFTHRSLRRFFERNEFSAFEIFDMIERERLSPRGRKLYPLLAALKRFPGLRYLAYPLMTSSQVFAVKRGAPSAARPETPAQAAAAAKG